MKELETLRLLLRGSEALVLQLQDEQAAIRGKIARLLVRAPVKEVDAATVLDLSLRGASDAMDLSMSGEVKK